MHPRRKLVVAVAAGIALLLALGAVWAWILPHPQPRPAPEAPKVPAPRAESGPPTRAPERIVRVQCRQGGCFWMRIIGIETVATTADGELRRLDYRSGTGFDDPAAPADGTNVEWETGARSSYAYCSTARPAYAFPGAGEGDDGLIVHHLDLFALGGYQYASARLYGLICHGLPTEGDAEPDWRGLGYGSGTRNEQARIEAPEALLSADR